MKNKKLAFLSFLLLFLISCQALSPRSLPTLQPSATPQVESARSIPTSTPLAQPEIAASPTAQPSLTPTNAPTAIPTPQIAEGVAAEQTIGDPYAPELGNGGYDVQRYTLRLSLDPAQVAILDALATIELTSTLDNLAQLSLDFIGYDVSSLTVAGMPAQYTRANGKLVIDLPQAFDQGQSFTIEVAYSGVPTFERSKYVPFEDHQGLNFYPSMRHLYVVSEPDGSRYWFPCNDHPRDKAAFRFEVTVPEELVAVANGSLVDTFTELPNALPDGRAGDRFIWEEEDPMATYLATVAVGSYVLVEGESPDGVPLRSYVFPEQQAYMQRMTPVIGEAIDWMAEQFGPYPFDNFGFVYANGLNGALETQTMVVIGTMDEEVMIHELSHQWFGNSVSLDSWGDMWRNEGFATYITAMWYGRDDPYILNREVRLWKQRFENQNRVLYPLNNPEPGDLFDVAQYEGGALLVADLREEVGDEDFLAGLRQYLEQYAGGAASHQQFQEAMEEASDRSFVALFSRWLKLSE